MEMDNFWLTLGEYVSIVFCSMLCSACALFALFLLRWLHRKRNFDMAPSLLVYLWSLLLCSVLLSLQYSLLSVRSLSAPSSGNSSSTQVIFWSGLLPGSLLPATPVSVFFLSLDRLLIILAPALYNRNGVKHTLAVLSAASIFGLFAMSLGVNLAQRPTAEMPECISFGCLTSNASRLIYAVNRLCVALPNFLAGTAFLVALFSFRRRMEQQQNGANSQPGNTRSRKMGDRLALYVVLFEFLFDLVPNLGNFLLTAFLNINVSVYVGAFRSMTYCCCALSSILAHTAILWRLFSAKTFSTSVVTVAPGQTVKRTLQSGRRHSVVADKTTTNRGRELLAPNS